ncbi:MAG: hypothetical protein HN562_02195 [Flavobacteriaceae bacterium]|nr:hypothetical protein [Flavobacteriaceae bacterium]
MEKSLVAHGGKKALSKVSEITYLKNIKLYDSIGELEKEINQKIKHTWDPSSTKMEWGNVDDQYVALLQEEKIELFKNNQMVLDSNEVAQAYNDTKGALYVFWQPYKLIDSDARLDYVGLVTLLDSISVHSLKVSYPLEPDADIWHYYFNEENFMLEATEVNHDGRISLIINESVEDKTGFFLNKTRKSYFVDSLGKIKYLRAAYKYTITSFN